MEVVGLWNGRIEPKIRKRTPGLGQQCGDWGDGEGWVKVVEVIKGIKSDGKIKLN